MHYFVNISLKLSTAEKKEFNHCIITAREFEAINNYHEALSLYRRAAQIRTNDPAIDKKIAKLEALCAEEIKANKPPNPKTTSSSIDRKPYVSNKLHDNCYSASSFDPFLIGDVSKDISLV